MTKPFKERKYFDQESQTQVLNEKLKESKKVKSLQAMSQGQISESTWETEKKNISNNYRLTQWF